MTLYYIDAMPMRSRPPVARSARGTWRPCGVCSKLTYTFRPPDRCVTCAAEIAWQVSLARQGAPVVWT
jgi:hypothetical protein